MFEKNSSETQVGNNEGAENAEVLTNSYTVGRKTVSVEKVRSVDSVSADRDPEKNYISGPKKEFVIEVDVTITDEDSSGHFKEGVDGRFSKYQLTYDRNSGGITWASRIDQSDMKGVENRYQIPDEEVECLLKTQKIAETIESINYQVS